MTDIVDTGKQTTTCLVKGEKVIIDLSRKDTLGISILAHEDCNDPNHDTSFTLNLTETLAFAHNLENLSDPGFVQLDDNRCEKRSFWRELEIFGNDKSDLIGYIGACSSQHGTRIKIQKHNIPIIVASICLADVDVRILLGILYFWISNQFLSLSTISNLLKNHGLHSNNVVVNIQR